MASPYFFEVAVTSEAGFDRYREGMRVHLSWSVESCGLTQAAGAAGIPA